MKKHWIEYSMCQSQSPMTCWVHVEADGKPWYLAEVFDPPKSNSVLGKGYAKFFVQFDDFVLDFSSLLELRICIETLSMKALPTSSVLSAKRGGKYGPSNHWLNRFPMRSMTWAHRVKLVKYLTLALADFEKETNGAAE